MMVLWTKSYQGTLTRYPLFFMNKKIAEAFGSIDRKNFIPKEYQSLAYEDTALPIGYEQTISQPSTIAFMLELLEVDNDQKILEIGSGSGYVLALLNQVADNLDIYGVEIIPELVSSSRKMLKDSSNIKIFNASSQLGLPQKAPFDRILVSATAKDFPKELINQLNDGGIIVCPVKNSIIKYKNGIFEEYPGFAFVPLISG